jgi:CBS domain containing-hemolysin-like protein
VDDNYKHPVDEKKVKFKRNPSSATRKENVLWVLIITFVSFAVSVVLTIVSSNILKASDIYTSFLVILFIILVNITFDIIGIAVTAADETPFHAMASRKILGARQAIRLIRNADKVSNFCNDVVGDICGIISGAAGAYIIFTIIGRSEEITVAELVITGLITALTVGGKAFSKILAIRNSNFIVYKVSVIIQFITGRFRVTAKKRKKQK